MTEIETVADRTGSGEPPRFLRLRQLVCRNRRADGSRSPDYPVEVIDRPRLDAVAVVVWRRPSPGAAPEVLLRDCLRPAAFFRRDADPPLADPRVYRVVPEEEDGRLAWMPLPALVAACADGTVEDAKTEIGAHRLAARLARPTGAIP